MFSPPVHPGYTAGPAGILRNWSVVSCGLSVWVVSCWEPWAASPDIHHEPGKLVFFFPLWILNLLRISCFGFRILLPLTAGSLNRAYLPFFAPYLLRLRLRPSTPRASMAANAAEASMARRK